MKIARDALLAFNTGQDAWCARDALFAFKKPGGTPGFYIKWRRSRKSFSGAGCNKKMAQPPDAWRLRHVGL
jgi:hypothetical protein